MEDAKKLIEHKDKKDIDIMALTLKSLSPLWSEDTHFEGIKEISLLPFGFNSPMLCTKWELEIAGRKAKNSRNTLQLAAIGIENFRQSLY